MAKDVAKDYGIKRRLIAVRVAVLPLAWRPIRYGLDLFSSITSETNGRRLWLGSDRFINRYYECVIGSRIVTDCECTTIIPFKATNSFRLSPSLVIMELVN